MAEPTKTPAEIAASLTADQWRALLTLVHYGEHRDGTSKASAMADLTSAGLAVMDAGKRPSDIRFRPTPAGRKVAASC